MNNLELLIVLFIGSILMIMLITIQIKWYGYQRWKSIIISVILVLTGVVGSRVWYFVENGAFVGRSFYGAVFLVPITFIPVAKALRISYWETLDMCAPAGCLTLALVKVQCLRDGCCEGVVLYINEQHVYVRFPSQMVEMIAFLIIGAVLLNISSKEKNRGRVFPWFLILYGASRFILNFFRDELVPYFLGLSAGCFWSLVALAIGVITIWRQNHTLRNN